MNKQTTSIIIFAIGISCNCISASNASYSGLTETCPRVTSALEDPTSAQITGGSIPSVASQLIWVRPAESTYKVNFSGTAGLSASHEGVDYVHDNQSITTVYVRAAADGRVAYVREGCEQSAMFTANTITRESGAGWGNHIVILHKNQIYTRYAHLLKGSILVNNGDSVKAGQIIGTMGNSGRSQLRHLHFELGTKNTEFNTCNMSQNFDNVFNPELLSYSSLSNQIILSTPTNNKDSVSTNPVLIWEKDATSTMYTVEVATDQSFNTIIKIATTSDNFLKLASLQPQSYYWRVKSNSLNYSQTWNFLVKPWESFENCVVNGLPTNWGRFVENVTNGAITHENAWVATNIDKKNTGRFSARMGNYMSVSDCWMVTPKIAITATNKAFSFNWSNTSGDYGSKLEVFASESVTQPTNSTTFSLLKTITEGRDALWHMENLDLSSFVNKEVYIGFKVHNFGNSTDANAGGDNWWIDDVTMPTQVINTAIPNHQSIISKSYISPNPISEIAKIGFTLSEQSTVCIDILDNSGKKIKKLTKNSTFSPGVHVYNWECNEIAKGLYFVLITTNNDTSLIKILKK